MIFHFILLICFIVFFFVIFKCVTFVDNTYGSHNLRLARLNDPRRKHINLDTLLLNVYDYWTEFNHPHAIIGSVAEWSNWVLVKLERNIRKKWSKDLVNVNILFEKFHEKDKFFNPTEFFEEYINEKYFELLIDWKKKHEKNCLEEKLHLNRVQIRHKKILGKSPRETIRG